MTIARILHGKLVQSELPLHLGHLGFVGFEHSHPDERLRPPDVLGDLFAPNVGDLLSLLIRHAVDQHAVSPRSFRWSGTFMPPRLARAPPNLTPAKAYAPEHLREISASKMSCDRRIPDGNLAHEIDSEEPDEAARQPADGSRRLCSGVVDGELCDHGDEKFSNIPNHLKDIPRSPDARIASRIHQTGSAYGGQRAGAG